MDHAAHWHVLPTEVFEDDAAHAASTGDEHKVAGIHRSVSFPVRRWDHTCV
jgi:hypothetical protein